MSIIFHIDVNSAFLSWSAIKLIEEGYGKDIREVPAIIGGNQETRHGIVVAKSIPAKKYGIVTAETVASAMQKCPNLLVIPPEHTYYRQQSRALMKHLSDICPIIEQVSVDECYMLFDPIADQFSSPEEAAYYIKNSVYEKFGFTVNVGISDRKVLAKMASDFEKPNKVHTLYAREIKEKMWPLPIGDLFMCGKSATVKFMGMGIRTIGDLAQTDPKLVETWMKSHGKMLWKFANGMDDATVCPVYERAKGVGNSTTVAQDITKKEEAYKVLKALSQSVSKRLIKGEFRAGSVCVEIKYADFVSASHQKPLITTTDDANKLYQEACLLFDELWTGEPVRLLGVRTTKLEDANEPQQMNLFDFQEQQVQDNKRKKLDAALADIRTKFGGDAIYKGQDFF